MIAVLIAQFVREVLIVAHILQVAPTAINVQDLVQVVIAVTAVLDVLEAVLLVIINVIFVIMNVFQITKKQVCILFHYQLYNVYKNIVLLLIYLLQGKVQIYHYTKSNYYHMFDIMVNKKQDMECEG